MACSYSLMERRESGSVRIHRLVQDVQRSRLSSREAADAVKVVGAVLIAALPIVDVSSSSQKQVAPAIALLPHVAALQAAAAAMQQEGSVPPRVLELASFVHSWQGEYHIGVAMLHSVLEASKRVLGDEHPDTLTSMNGLASALTRAGQHAEAAAMYLNVWYLNVWYWLVH